MVFRGTPLEAIDRVCLPRFQQVVSQSLLDELTGVLVRKFQYTRVAVDAVVEAILKDALMVSTRENITASRDPDDNRVLECAVAGQANLIVSGDKDLLVLGTYDGIPIITIRQFLDSQLS